MTDHVAGYLEVGTNGLGEVVVNHPKLEEDANGVGHIVFSPEQASAFAQLVIEKSIEARRERRALGIKAPLSTAPKQPCAVPLDGPSAMHSAMADEGDLDEHIAESHPEARS